jgi:hypothetical protein
MSGVMQVTVKAAPMMVLIARESAHHLEVAK